MPSENDHAIPIFPITGWDIAPVVEYEMIMVRLPFLSHPMQKMHEADPGRTYGIALGQLRELIPALQRALQKLENAGPQGTPSDAPTQ